MQTTCAAGALGAGRLDHLLDTRQVLGKVADVAAGLATGRARGRSRRPLIIVGRSGRRTRFQIAQVEHALARQHHAAALGARAMNQCVQRLQRGLQPLDFGVALEHHRDEQIRVSRQVLRPKRHGARYPEIVIFPSRTRNFSPPASAFSPPAAPPLTSPGRRAEAPSSPPTAAPPRSPPAAR